MDGQRNPSQQIGSWVRDINSPVLRLWGHLFGGRYRSILIENQDYGGAVWRDYLRTAIDYVHLNPGRAGLIDAAGESSADYPWSSLATAYQLPPSKRPGWIAVEETLDLFQYKDTARGRRQYIARLDEWIKEEKGVPAVDGKSIEERINRGWFWGSEDFKESLLKLYEKGMELSGRKSNRVYQSGSLMKDH